MARVYRPGALAGGMEVEKNPLARLELWRTHAGWLLELKLAVSLSPFEGLSDGNPGCLFVKLLEFIGAIDRAYKDDGSIGPALWG